VNRPRPSRSRRIAKWVGVLACGLIVSIAHTDFAIQQCGGGIRTTDIVFYLVPFILLATATSYLWWRDRPYPRGRCQFCGYNLTGNISGICSECGAPIRSQDQPDLPFAMPSLCAKCGCDLTGRFTGRCPECGAPTPKFPPGHCPMCGYSLTAGPDDWASSPLTPKQHFCIMCKRWHDHRYPRGHCQECGFGLGAGGQENCPECGAPHSTAEGDE
jgi:predicted amidophosphoribosyltransferase